MKTKDSELNGSKDSLSYTAHNFFVNAILNFSTFSKALLGISKL
jgi:hypothetical protein